MSLPRDLLDQAKHLARKEPRRPKQASLRRAVSSAYYALFHLLVEAACDRLVSGPGHDRERLRLVLRRAFVHGDMKAVSRSFSGGTLASPWSTAGLAHPPTDLQDVATAFVDLQQARHEADYDLSRTFVRQEVYDFVRQCEEAFRAWERCRRTHAADVYLVALLVNKQLRS